MKYATGYHCRGLNLDGLITQVWILRFPVLSNQITSTCALENSIFLMRLADKMFGDSVRVTRSTIFHVGVSTRLL